MNCIEKQAAFYRGYLTDERSLPRVNRPGVGCRPLATRLPRRQRGGGASRYGRLARRRRTFIRDRPAASLPIGRDAFAPR
jgi:hypothetical protein